MESVTFKKTIMQNISIIFTFILNLFSGCDCVYDREGNIYGDGEREREMNPNEHLSHIILKEST